LRRQVFYGSNDAADHELNSIALKHESTKNPRCVESPLGNVSGFPFSGVRERRGTRGRAYWSGTRHIMAGRKIISGLQGGFGQRNKERNEKTYRVGRALGVHADAGLKNRTPRQRRSGLVWPEGERIRRCVAGIVGRRLAKEETVSADPP